MNDYHKYSDAELLSILREPGPVCEYALGELMYRYSDNLSSYCSFKAANKLDGQEIFQDTWMALFNAAVSGKAIRSVEHYLYAIASNIAIEYSKNMLMPVITEDEFDISALPDFDDAIKMMERSELLAHISSAVDFLEDVYKETFVLHWFSDLSYPAIAEIREETVNCIKARSYRAMEKILKFLKPIIKDLSK